MQHTRYNVTKDGIHITKKLSIRGIQARGYNTNAYIFYQQGYKLKVAV